jgi:DNA-binding beta-propeller fold protein YncE
VAAIDHDSYSVTVVDTRTLRPRTLPAAPLGPGAFDKPHYGAVTAGGRLVLPFQGRVLLLLDPVTGRSSRLPLTAETHQHGVALTATGRAVIVGTGPAGSVEGPASLTVVDIETGEERVTPLRRAHERVAVRADGRRAYLSGGYLLEAGAWDGVSVVDLATGRVVREIRVPSRPLGIAVLP